jgi:hypothetical protein
MSRFTEWNERRRRRADARYGLPPRGSFTMPNAQIIPIGEPVTEIPHVLLCGPGCPCQLPDPTPPPTLCPTCSSDDPRSVGDEGLPDIDAPIMCDNDFHRLAAAVQPPDPKGTK